MHDIRAIRENPDSFDAAMARRGLSGLSARILALDETRRTAIHAVETLRAEMNAAAKQVGQAKAAGDQALFKTLRESLAAKKRQIAENETLAKAQDTALRDLLMGLPNMVADDVPDGKTEDDNVQIRTWGSPRDFNFAPREHYQLPAAQGMDFETAAKLSGARFVVLRGAMARLHRALAQFMLDLHVDKHGLNEMNVPVLVRDKAMYGTGQLPKFGEDSFFGASLNSRRKLSLEAIKNYGNESDTQALCADGKPLSEVVGDIFERAPTREDFWLIPTAEVPLTNTVAGATLDASALPIRMTAHTLCFRSEAGSAGKDTTGMLRQHQFEKVEMVSIVHPDESEAEHQRMTDCAQNVLEALNLPYRTVILCTGDLGFGARRTHDIEVWLPGQDTYREISSISTCGDFQARRMNARFRPGEGEKPAFVHTLNGSGLAVGRCLIAVLENGQQEDGSVTLPAALHPYLGGKTQITADGVLA